MSGQVPENIKEFNREYVNNGEPEIKTYGVYERLIYERTKKRIPLKNIKTSWFEDYKNVVKMRR